jgi:Tfp pilus assembly protein PilO
MADKPHVSIKQTKIDKAYTTMLITIGLASFIVVFSLISSKVLFSQYGYQSRIITAKQAAVSQLKSDINSASALVSTYKEFVNQPVNILDNTATGSGQNNGNNAKIILDALPSQYDFPGLISSLDNILSNQGYTLTAISGTDQELTQQSPKVSTTPLPVQIPFEIVATGSYTSIQQLISTLQLSIRPIVIQQISLSGTDTTLTANITAFTFYQPAKTFSIGSEVVK